MVLQGDLSSIDLADVLQNIESHGRTGTIRLDGEHGVTYVHVADGQVAMYAAEDRPPVLDSLVDLGLVSAKDLTAVQSRGWGRKRTVGQTLVMRKLLAEQDLVEALQTNLLEDVCTLLASSHGEFQFREGPPTSKVFDPEEEALGLRLPVSALVLEAARRSDHWTQIRKVIPSDSVSFIAVPGALPPESISDPDLAQRILKLLDGSRDVHEVVSRFRRKRFQAREILAEMVRGRIVRAAGGDDIAALARSLEDLHPRRALTLVRRGLDSEPHHRELLLLTSTLAHKAGRPAESASAHKVLAHLAMEDKDTDRAQEHLLNAAQLHPKDPAVHERLLSLAIETRRPEDAVRHGLALVGIYRKPGLHQKALETAQRLVDLDPGDPKLRVQLARCQVDCGNPEVAVPQLMELSRVLIAERREDEARRVLVEVRTIDPSHKEAAESIRCIDQQEYTRKRVRRRARLQIAALVAVALILLLFLGADVVARLAASRIERQISEARLIEQGRYAETTALWRELRERYPLAFVARWEFANRIRELEHKPDGSGAKADGTVGAESSPSVFGGLQE